MKYFCLTESLDTKIIGKYVQAEKAEYHCSVWDEPRFIEHTQFEKIHFEPIIANAILYPKAKITDLISVVSMGFTLKLLISGKLKSILENYRKTGLQFFKSDIIHKGNFISDYWILNAYEIDMQFIDYKRSEIVSRKRKSEGGTFLVTEDINTFEEFNRKQNEIKDSDPGSMFIKKIHLIENIDQDFFILLHVEGAVKYVVSEKLKNEIEEAGCTGIEFQPSELSYDEWLAQEGPREKIYGKI
ncbi:imm11 family protein [Flavobacterium cerinum]|uniref:Immunity MXAN-0049 protein domain-containing protein n=1 Tax=Flavobacterium cerinum TaxID=2502784 RepID=A0A3S3TZB1_9FLAO|nr:DUF1629 domain-containing protein [Flavobacterium cerinum]RWW98775.1 hypothetical protein EPI11_12670 [Flavobacterium cerinum]